MWTLEYYGSAPFWQGASRSREIGVEGTGEDVSIRDNVAILIVESGGIFLFSLRYACRQDREVENFVISSNRNFNNVSSSILLPPFAASDDDSSEVSTTIANDQIFPSTGEYREAGRTTRGKLDVILTQQGLLCSVIDHHASIA